MTNYILGSGIAGLIFAYYNKDFKIICPEIGGQFNTEFDLGPRFLHNTEENKNLLKSLNFPIIIKKIKVGYVLNNKFIKPTEEFKYKYYMKSRSTTDIKYVDKSIMNENKNEFEALDINFFDLLIKIKEKIGINRFIKDKIISINIIKKIMQGQRFSYTYNKLISTIPKNILEQLMGINSNHLKAIPITFVLLSERYFNCKDYNFIYVLNNCLHHRLTKTKNNIIADIAGYIDEKELNDEYKNFLIDFKTINNIQIVNGDDTFLIKDKNITLFGRYGTWNHNWKIETCIKEALKYVKKNG